MGAPAQWASPTTEITANAVTPAKVAAKTLGRLAYRRLRSAMDARPGPDQVTRSTSMALVSAMAFAGFRPLGQTWAQFMMVWQR